MEPVGKRAVFTALMGGYERLNEQPIAAQSDIPFICFTDDPELRSDSWDVRVVEPRFDMDSIRSARHLKLLGAALLPEASETLWIDNSVKLRTAPERILDEWLSSADIAMPVHSYRASVMGEFDAVATDGYDDPGRVYEQLIHYATVSPNTLREKPYWTALLARRSSPAVDAAMQLWHDHLLRYSRRDQLSINFVLGAIGSEVNGVEIDNMSSEWHEWPVRIDRKWSVTTDRMSSALRIPSVELGRLENALNASREEIGLLRKQVDEFRTRTRSAESVVEEYRNSTSWRVTAPLRAIFRPRRS